MLLNKQTNKQILTLVRRDFVLKVYCSGGRRTIVMGFLDGSDGKESASNTGDSSLASGLGRSPGEGMATHFSILAWRILWTEEPGGLYSVHGIKKRQTTTVRLTCPMTNLLLDISFVGIVSRSVCCFFLFCS